MTEPRDFSHDLEIAPFSQAFDRGNYGSAYENEDWDAWRYEPDQLEAVCKAMGFKHVAPCTSQAIEGGLALGFFSSYELHEVPEHLREWVGALRRLNADLADAAGVAL